MVSSRSCFEAWWARSSVDRPIRGVWGHSAASKSRQLALVLPRPFLSWVLFGNGKEADQALPPSSDKARVFRFSAQDKAGVFSLIILYVHVSYTPGASNGDQLPRPRHPCPDYARATSHPTPTPARPRSPSETKMMKVAATTSLSFFSKSSGQEGVLE